ncbi:GH25 family lysozyme [Clostridium novyi]|uniref:Glycosyl hydrolase, family 25 n=1 Tax=Clostridium novyi (strain NT) TaxID=386415 RepID=A0Q0M0_CLONN|nr:GH25 family lysozyme [Clostridium novyi]ABK60795.1 glycosyl hydrolase, family 25 [Clostridium novyi NT]KEH84869.1 glycosyl hydrolase [Clostridium novyi A str. NCTC 538]KEH85057.1 glycosyl hydrolase [Clostridium novyi A str. 4540]KEH91190.1 glycosyl hydrolase [Clostridium novyi A str. GD211209]
MQCASNKIINGIDISNWQSGINYDKLKRNTEVVIIKATEGVDFIDKMFLTHYNGCKTAGLKIGFYHFFSDKSNPTKQARDFWNTIKNKKMHVIPVLDIETSKRSKTEVTNRCLEFLKEMERLSGFKCIIYTYTSFAIEKLDKRLSSYPLWIAHYGVASPHNNGIWNKWVGFQYTDKARIEGVPNTCDANKFTPYIFINSDFKVPQNNSIIQEKPLWQLSISGDIVKDLQRELNRQFNKGLKVDGYFGNSTLNACILVRRGARGNITKIIQQRLIDKGYYVGIYKADGVFRNDTELAVKKFQKNNNLKVDGIVGIETWKALFKK